MVINLHRRRDMRHVGRYHVILNGRDVTQECFFVDSRRGIVRRYMVGTDGMGVINDTCDGIQTEELRGRVRLKRSTKRRSTK